MTDIETYVNAYVETLDSDTSNPVPMATTDADEVIRAQLTENTGRHFLDSGSAYGRHWEENQDNPPWEQPRWNVREDYVVQNIYDHLSRSCRRDDFAVSLEIALYAYGLHGPGEGDSWLSCREGFADSLGDSGILRDELEDLGVPVGVAEDVAFGINPEETFTFNTYNSEFGTLSQDIQTTMFGGPYAEYAAVQVHGGCDIRGGYTAPRVYKVTESIMPMELEYHCGQCDSFFYESCHGRWGGEVIHLDHPTYPDLEDALQERDYDAHVADIELAVEEAHTDNEPYDGGIFHLCGDGRIGHMTVA
jgi:hypothetical protein